MPRKLKFVKRLKNSNPISAGMINYTSDHLRTMIAVEDANGYGEMPPIPEVNIEGYDPNFSASVNAINTKLKHEEEFITVDFTKVNLVRIFYPLILFTILIGIASS